MGKAIKVGSRHRQLFLFLIALILPSLAVVLLGLRIIAQERELEVKRRIDAERRSVAGVRIEILARLERIRLQQTDGFPSRTDAAVALVGWAERGRLVLPWDVEGNADQFRKAIAEAEFARKIEAAERFELVEQRYDRAARGYREALTLAKKPSQSTYARLLLARALVRGGQRNEAHVLYQSLLNLPSRTIDEHGVPIALYAAGRLLDENGSEPTVLRRIEQESDTFGTFSPSHAYVVRGVLETLRASKDAAIRERATIMVERLSARIRFLEQALALQSDFVSLRPTPASWLAYGSDPWLIGLSSPRADKTTLVIVVNVNAIARTVETENSAHASGFQFKIVQGVGSSEPLGESLPGLGVMFSPRSDAEAARSLNLQRSFYLLSLSLVVGLTALGGYLLWRDMRRELRIAELRSQFVASVSHELKTPLTAIRMFAETLQMRGAADPQKHAEYLDTIVTESERLTRLLNNVLDFSLIERGQKSYHMQPAQLDDVLHAAVRTMHYPLREQGFDLRLNIGDGFPPMNLDRDAIEQAILNLLTNAMKYSGQSRQIDLCLCREGGSALIQVVDHGVGIPVQEQQRIFEKFYRAPTPENRSISGTGLGLALVTHIATAHGGRVELASRPGGGSTFSIRLPINGDGGSADS